MFAPSFLSRFVHRIGEARRNRQTERVLSQLPQDVQKDIGWPTAAERHATPHGRAL
jgi:hypothetical protein